MLRFSALLLALFLFEGCLSEDGGFQHTCPPDQSIKNAAGHVHGVPCTRETEADCLYGFCELNPFSTNGSVGICTKSCAACENSDCASENADGMSFTCLRVSDHGERCVPKCTSLADCQRISPDYTDCTNNPPWSTYGTIGVYKFCVIEPSANSAPQGNSQE